MVAKRVLPLVVAFALAFAPVALEACQVTCLSQEADTVAGSPAHHHHSHSAPVAATPAAHVHHHDAATSSTVLPASIAVMTALPHACDHGDDLPAVPGALTSVIIAPVVLATTFTLPEPHPRLVRVRDTEASASSERIPLTTHLRV